MFVGGQPLDPNVNRFPGTEFYRTVHDLPGLGTALRTGERGTLDPYELFAAARASPVIRALRPAAHRT